jgi:hypothetical protein
MDRNKLAWLLKCADKLRSSQPDVVDVAQLLTQLGVAYRTVAGSDGYGELRIGEGRRFQVIIKTATGQLLWNRRERFAAAHELAHFLLVQKWDYRPSRSDEREYFLCEGMCNRFAGRLLIDPKAVFGIDCNTPESCIDGVLNLAARYHVSLQVAAKELAMNRHGLAVCYALPLERKITWGISSIGGFKETRNRAFGFPHAKNLHDLPAESESGRACAFWLYERLPAVSINGDLRIGTLSLKQAELVSIITNEAPGVFQQQAPSGWESAFASRIPEEH